MPDEDLERLLESYRRSDSKLSRSELEALIASDKPTDEEREAMSAELEEDPGLLPHEPAPSLTDRCLKMFRIR
jgi:hypothetical protein